MSTRSDFEATLAGTNPEWAPQERPMHVFRKTSSRGGFVAGSLCASLGSMLVAPAIAAAGPTFGRTIERYYLAGRFDGIALIGRGDRIIYRGAAGFANRERQIPHSFRETFRIASLTKQFTALLVMQEVERSTLELDAPIGTYLSSLPSDVAPLTLRQLLGNVSGLPNLDAVPDAYTRTDYTADDLPAYVARLPLTPLLAAPGTTFVYNNLDFIVAGAVLQRASGKTFASLLDERIIQKLGLHATGVYAGTIPPAHPVGYEAAGVTDLIPERIGKLENFGPAGAMYSTLDEIARWDRALLRNELLSKRSTDEMFRSDKRFGYVALGSWAYDLRVRGRTESVHLVERQGNIGGIQILNLIAPLEDVALVMMANTDHADLFDTYSKSGLPYDLLSLALATRG